MQKEIKNRFKCYDEHIIALEKNVQSHEFWLLVYFIAFVIILLIAFFWVRHEFRDVQEQIPQGEWECVEYKFVEEGNNIKIINNTEVIVRCSVDGAKSFDGCVYIKRQVCSKYQFVRYE